MGIDTKITLISCIVTEILTKERFSLTADLICILGGLPKDNRVASFIFLKSTPRTYRNSKKTLYGRYCKVHQQSGVWQPDYKRVRSFHPNRPKSPWHWKGWEPQDYAVWTQLMTTSWAKFAIISLCTLNKSWRSRQNRHASTRIQRENAVGNFVSNPK